MATLMAAMASIGSSAATALGASAATANAIGTATAYAATGAAAAKGLKSLQPKMPAMKEEKVMPTPDDENMRTAKRQALAKQKQRGGRKSTIMTAMSDGKLGG